MMAPALLKLIKLIFIAVVIVFISWCISNGDNRAKSPVPSGDNSEISPLKNEVTHAKYTTKIGKWDLSAYFEECAMHSSKDVILTKIIVNLSKKSRKIEIKARKCNLSLKTKKAHLFDKITISSNDFEIEAKEADVDWKKKIISGNAEITGKKDQISFVAQGFSMKENGEITLKKANFNIGSRNKK